MQNSGSRSAESAETGALAPPPLLAIPDKWRRMLVPADHRLLQPVNHWASHSEDAARRGRGAR